MPLITAVAGPYVGTYTPGSSTFGASGGGGGAVGIGILNDNGFELSWVTHQDHVAGTDQYGGSLLETIYRGADWRVRFVCQEWGSGSLNAAWPWGLTGAKPLGPVMGVVSRLGSQVAGVLTLTVIAGSPASGVTVGPATLTGNSVIASDNNTVTQQFTSKLRQLPTELIFLPVSNGGNPLWFSTT